MFQNTPGPVLTCRASAAYVEFPFERSTTKQARIVSIGVTRRAISFARSLCGEKRAAIDISLREGMRQFWRLAKRSESRSLAFSRERAICGISREQQLINHFPSRATPLNCCSPITGDPLSRCSTNVVYANTRHTGDKFMGN